MSESEKAPLKLRAHDPEDMDVIAAVLQDALVPMTDVTFLRKEKRFILVVNRFNWSVGSDKDPNQPTPEPPGEDASFEDQDGPPPFERINSGVCFDKVVKVQSRGLPSGDKKEILNLLTIKAEPKAITLIFSEEAAIRLDVSAIRCHLEDLGRAWPTRWRPDHHLDDRQEESREEDAAAPG